MEKFERKANEEALARRERKNPSPKKNDITLVVEYCKGCGLCVDICPTEVYELQDEKSVPVNAEECLGCESCVEVCEEEAITVEET